MAITILPLGDTGLEVNISGKLEKQDYEEFVPAAEQKIREEGKVDLLVRISDFEGWSVSALWEDLKFDYRHYNDVSRLALVGRTAAEKWMATLSKPFTGADVEYYSEREIGLARRWIRGEPANANPSA